MLFQLGQVRVGDRVRHLRRAVRDPQRGALRFREKRAPLKLPERILLFCGNADAFSRVRGVHAVDASSGTTRHLRDHVAELRIDRRARPVDCRAELGKGAQDFGPPRHDQLGVREKPHPAFRGSKDVPKVRDRFTRQWCKSWHHPSPLE